MSKKIISVLIMSFIFSSFLFAGGKPESSGTKPGMRIKITNSTGNTVVLKGYPKRIVFAGRASIMVADALYMFPEAQQRVVGVGATNQGRGNFTKIVDTGYSGKIPLGRNAGAEQIAAAKPDLVILKNYLKRDLGNPVSELGIPVIYLSLETPELYEKDFEVLGKVFNDPRRAEKIVSYYRTMSSSITSRTDKLSSRPKVLFIYHSARDGEVAFNVPPKNWLQTRMVEMAGGDPVWIHETAGSGWVKVNFEQIAAWNPDQIYVTAYKQNVKKVVAELLSSARWKKLKAVQNNKVAAIPVDFYSWDQPDSRWILGAAWLAKEIHPALFEDFDIKKITRNFYKELYYMKDTVYNKEIKTRLGW